LELFCNARLDGRELTYCRRSRLLGTVASRKHVKYAVMSVYIIARFICTILSSAYTCTTLPQKVTRYACDYRIRIKYRRFSI